MKARKKKTIQRECEDSREAILQLEMKSKSELAQVTEQNNFKIRKMQEKLSEENKFLTLVEIAF